MTPRMYTDLAMKDVFRLWSASQLQIIIIAGICLPILMLLGLKNGHVADLREDLITSPTGRQIIFWSAKQGDFLSDEVLREIRETVPNVALIIPESQKLVFIRPQVGGGTGGDPASLTLYSTLPSDPILEQFGADIGWADPKTRPLILAEATARALGARIGDKVTTTIKRRLGAEEQEHDIEFTVAGSVATGDESAGLVGFAHVETMAALEQYGTGEAVPTLGIAAMDSLRAVDQYAEMLLVCFRGPTTDLTTKDHEFLAERGLEATEITDPDVTFLYGTLKPEAGKDLKFYLLHYAAEEANVDAVIRDNPELLSRNTEAQDDLILRWCRPRMVAIAGTEYRFVGLTLPKKRQTGGWIQNYLRPDSLWFSYDESMSSPLTFRADLVAEKALSSEDVAIVPGVSLRLRWLPPPPQEEQAEIETTESNALVEGAVTVAASPESTTSPSTVFVPASLLAYVNQASRKEVTLDREGGKFVPVSRPVSFTKARMYTTTIDDVPRAADLLAKRKFAVLSEVSRIAEIQQQDGSLQVLVTVVALGMFLFGVITVFSVLVDSTDRKKGMIGILRVMGIPGSGVFMILLVRAIVIGVMAAVLCCVIGVSLASILSKSFSGSEYLAWVPSVHVVLGPAEYFLVMLGAVLCAALGVLLPALKASRLDPFDAITEGQFH